MNSKVIFISVFKVFIMIVGMLLVLGIEIRTIGLFADAPVNSLLVFLDLIYVVADILNLIKKIATQLCGLVES